MKLHTRKVFEKGLGETFFKKFFPPMFFALAISCLLLSVPAKALDFVSPGGDSFSEGFAWAPEYLKAELEKIYYRTETINGLSVIVPNPTAQVESELENLGRKYPKEPAIPLLVARVKVELGKFDAARSQMERYVSLSNRSPNALLNYADFLHSRLLFEEEVRILEEAGDVLARGSDQDKKLAKGVYSRIIRLINSTNLKKFDVIVYHKKIVALYPTDDDVAWEYVQALRTLGKTDEALKEAEKFELQFAEHKREWLKLRADILKKGRGFDEAIKLYDSLGVGDDEGLFDDYFSLLEEAGRLSALLRNLNLAVWAQDATDSSTMAKWFWYKALHGEFEDAQRGLKEWIKKLEASGRLKDNLSAIGELLLNTDNLAPASPYFYTLYVTATDDKTREYALWGLFRALVNSGSQQGVFSWGYAPGADLMGLDNLPSIGGGVLSLVLNDQRLTAKSKELENVSVGYRNQRMSAIVVDEMRKLYPASKYLPRMELALIERAVLVQDWASVEYFAKSFVSNYPADTKKYDAMFALGLSYRNRGMFPAEEDVYAQIMKEAYNSHDEELYYRAFYENVNSLTNQNRYSDVLKLYWREIKLHPENEKLYEELLNFAREHDLFNEELKAYQQAIKQFNKSDWYNKLARWYLEREGEDDFRRAVVKLREGLDEPMLDEFFSEFLTLDWGNLKSAGNLFYLECYLYANKKFPHNLNFVRGLINFYEANSRNGAYIKELEALRVRYFIFDESIRRGLFERWSDTGYLTQLLNSLKNKKERNIAENFILAFALAWVGEHEEELPILQKLANLYSGSQTLWKHVAQLERSLANSFGERNSELATSSTQRYLYLARLYPLNTDYAISAGEVFAENGDLAQARETWWKIVETEPASPQIYKELASVFWDYYQFDDAIEAIRKIREIQGSPLLFAMELGNIYEWKGDYERAIGEYVKYHCEQRSNAGDALERLVFLAQNKDKGQAIEKGYQSEIANRPKHYNSLLAYSDYLFEVGKKAEALSLLEMGLKQYGDVDFLRECSTIFAQHGRRDLQEKALLQIVEQRGGDYDAYMELVAFYESRKLWDKAERIYLILVELSQGADDEYQSQMLTNLASFYWRRGEFQKGLKYYLVSAEKLKYEKREALLYETARKCINQGLLDEAAQILTELIRTNSQESSYFNLLAQVYTIRGDVDSLVVLYKQALDTLRKVEMSQDARKERLLTLREGLALSYANLNRYDDALEQYIEMINLDPLSESGLREVYDFAVQHNLLDKLISYYKDLAERAYKNYRWQVVLGRIYTWEGKRDLAREALRKAIKLEPQRDWLHQELADLYLADGMFNELVATYEELARLASDSSVWNMRIASALFRAGRREEAIKKANASIGGNPPSLAPYFELADFFVTWEVPQEADRAIKSAVAKFQGRFCEEAMGVYEARKLVRAKVFTSGFEGTFEELIALRDFVLDNLNKNNCVRRELLNQSLESINLAIAQYLPRELADYGASFDFERMSQKILNWAMAEDSEEVFNLCLNFAMEAHLSDLERDLYAQWLTAHKDDLRVVEKREQYIRVLREFEKFFTKRREYGFARYLRAISPSLLNYRLLAHIQRVVEDEQGEIASLGEYINGFSNTGLGGFSGENEEVGRFVQLLLKRKRDNELKELIGKPSSLTGYFINELIANGRPDLATFAVNEGCKEKGRLWQDAKTALILSYFGDYSNRTFALFGRLLGIATIGESVAGKRNDILADRSWTQYAWYYADFLDRAGKKEYKGWLNAPAEANPTNEQAYLKIGDYQMEHKRYKEALAQYELASQVALDSVEAGKRYAKALYQMGRKEDAIDALMTMINDTEPSTYLSVYEVLVEVGEKERAEKILANYLVRVWAKQPAGVYGLLGVLMDSWRDNTAEKENILKRLAQINPQDIYFFQTVIEKKWLKGTALNFCYEKIIEILEGETPVNEDLRNEWRLEYQKHLISCGDFNRAFALIRENERLGILDDEALSLAKAKLFLKMGNLNEAEIEIRKYLGSEPSSSHYEVVISLFDEMGYRDEADKWREEMFRKNIAQGSDNANDYVGLAEILIKRGESKRAIEYLEMLILSSPENPEGLRISAVFAENHGLFNEALRWRKMLIPLAFDDDFNKFQIAWLTAKTGKLDEGVDLLIKLLNNSRTTNVVRLKAGIMFPRLVAQRKDLLAKLEQDALERMRISPRQEDFILLANLKSGDVKNQKQVLEGALSSLSHPYYCAWMLADIYESEGNLSAVSEYLHKVVYYLPHRDDVFILLSEVELKRGKTRRALDALPSVGYQYALEPTPDEGEIAKVRFALRSVESDPHKRAEFFIRLSESAEQLDWLDMAIAFASEALNILEEEERTSTIKAQLTSERGWRKWFIKEGTPPKDGRLSEISQRIEHLKNKRAQKLKAKSSLLRITSNLENVP